MRFLDSIKQRAMVSLSRGCSASVGDIVGVIAITAVQAQN